MPAKPEHYNGLVKATTRGYANGTIYDAGEMFQFDGPLGSWMEKVEPAAKPREVAQAKG